MPAGSFWTAVIIIAIFLFSFISIIIYLVILLPLAVLPTSSIISILISNLHNQSTTGCPEPYRGKDHVSFIPGIIFRRTDHLRRWFNFNFPKGTLLPKRVKKLNSPDQVRKARKPGCQVKTRILLEERWVLVISIRGFWDSFLTIREVI